MNWQQPLSGTWSPDASLEATPSQATCYVIYNHGGTYAGVVMEQTSSSSTRNIVVAESTDIGQVQALCDADWNTGTHK